MEADPNPMPRFDLFPRLTRLAHFLLDHIQSPGLSDHARGGGPALDSELYDQLELPYGDIAYHDVTMPPNRWDSEGRYYED